MRSTRGCATQKPGVFTCSARSVTSPEFPTYVVGAELAVARVLSGSLSRPEFPPALRVSAPPWWRRISAGALKFADGHARRDDAVACAGNLAVAALAEAHARLCERGEWYLMEKDMLERAGLHAVQPVLRSLGSELGDAIERTRADLAVIRGELYSSATSMRSRPARFAR